jgi:hypothetical protein
MDGVQLFARYAHAPNALGFCGPSSGVAGSEEQVRAAARRFSGAWPYLQVLARLTGTDDPLEHRLVEAYWLGRDLGVDHARFADELLAVIGPQAGHYWTHLTPELLASGSPDHGFHVFGVYPWSRLLGAGPEPLHVLDSCRIRWGVVVGRDGTGAEVSTSHLTWDGAVLDLAGPTVERIPEANVQVDVEVGDQVALHWEWLCDHLTPTQCEALEASTRRELTATTARLVGSAVR